MATKKAMITWLTQYTCIQMQIMLATYTIEGQVKVMWLCYMEVQCRGKLNGKKYEKVLNIAKSSWYTYIETQDQVHVDALTKGLNLSQYIKLKKECMMSI